MRQTVDSYAPPAGQNALLAYPFERPEGSFLTDGHEIHPLADTLEGFGIVTNVLLRERGVPGLDSRIPVIAYGANSNPHKLAQKMDKFAKLAPELAAELLTVPHVKATFPGTAVVWHGKPGQRGSTFAEFYQDETTADAKSEGHISYLTPHQLAAMHTTEGVTYNLVGVEAHAGTDNQPVKAYVYVAGQSCVLLKDGRPVMVKRNHPSESDAHQAMTVEEAIDYMCQNAPSDPAATAQELIASMTLDIPLAERKARQTRIQEELGAVSVSRSFSFPDGGHGFVGRADFNFEPNGVLQLAEQALVAMRPTDPQKRNAVEHDIMVKLRERAHDELAAYLKANPVRPL